MWPTKRSNTTSHFPHMPLIVAQHHPLLQLLAMWPGITIHKVRANSFEGSFALFSILKTWAPLSSKLSSFPHGRHVQRGRGHRGDCALYTVCAVKEPDANDTRFPNVELCEYNTYTDSAPWTPTQAERRAHHGKASRTQMVSINAARNAYVT